MRNHHFFCRLLQQVRAVHHRRGPEIRSIRRALPQFGLALVLALGSLLVGTALASPTAENVLRGPSARAAALQPAAATAQWHDNQRSYRLLISVTADALTYIDKPVDIDIDFTQRLAAAGSGAVFDVDSLRLVEIDQQGNLVAADLPYQFDPDEGYDAATNAAGTLTFIVDGTTEAGELRLYYLYFAGAAANLTAPDFPAQVTLTPFVPDQGKNTFQTTTAQATYYFQVDGGGFSSIDDRDGNDWISFSNTGTEIYRGLPNLIHPEGGFHPAGQGTTTSLVNRGPLKVSYRATFGSEWEALWEIFPTYARMTLVKAAHNYWFLYEGTPGGTLDTGDLVVLSDGTSKQALQNQAKERWCRDTSGMSDWQEPCTNDGGDWSEEWVYFADPSVGSEGRAFFLAHHGDDAVIDSYKRYSSIVYPMTVFGFGRLDTLKFFTAEDTDEVFTFGLIDEIEYADAAALIRSAVGEPGVSIGLLEAAVNDSSGTSSTIATDGFNACTLDNAIWTFVDPAAGTDAASSYVMTGTRVRIDVPAGTTHSLWDGGIQVPHIRQTINNADFEVDVKFDSELTEDVQLQGVFIAQDEDDYLRFSLQSEILNDSLKLFLFGARIADGSPTALFKTPLPASGKPLFMRVNRTGFGWTVSYSYDGFDWISNDDMSVVSPMTTQTLGIFAGNERGNPAFSAKIDYVYRTDSDVDPTDTRALSLEDILGQAPIDPSGIGTILGEPLNETPTNPTCGDPFRLVASAIEPGWTFSEWQATSFTSDENPLERSFAFGENLIAKFDRIQYTVTANVSSNGDGIGGSVEISPTNLTFVYGDVVSLLASANPGWQFSGWSGDIDGSVNPVQATIAANLSVTATFTQERYQLLTTAVDAETGAETPENLVQSTSPADPEGYVYGEQADVTAMPAEGWAFAYWNGDPTDTARTKSVTITGPTSLTARFIRARYPVTTFAVDQENAPTNQGSIVLTPPADAAGYLWGEIVTATAIAEPGWIFVNWSGALSGQSNPDSLTVAGATEVTATFRPTDKFTLTTRVDGQGNVTKSPNRDEFDDQETVTLRAVPADGWRFRRWEGDVPASDRTNSQITLVMSENKVLTVVFVQDGSDTLVYLPYLINQ